MKLNGELKGAQVEASKTVNLPDHSGSYGGLKGRILYNVDTSEFLVDSGTAWVAVGGSDTYRHLWKRKQLGANVTVDDTAYHDVIGFTGLTAGTYTLTVNLNVHFEDDDDFGKETGLKLKVLKNGVLQDDAVFRADSRIDYGFEDQSTVDGPFVKNYYDTFTVTYRFVVSTGTETVMVQACEVGDNPTSYTERFILANGSNAYLEQLPTDIAAGTWTVTQ